MSNLIPYDFRGNNVRVVVDERGEPWFVGVDICVHLGYSNQNDAMNRHCRGVVKRYPIPDALGRMQESRVLSEPDMLRLIVNSQLPAATEFERWVFEEVLPSIRRTGSYSASHAQIAPTTDACVLIESMARALNLPPSATLGMYQKLGGKIGHADLLPVYAVDSPVDDGTSHVTRSLSELLKDHGVPVSARRMYQALEAAGLVVRRSRPSSNGGAKEFWSLTDAGLAYGKNITSPNNQRETQVHLYESEFLRLLEVLGPL